VASEVSFFSDFLSLPSADSVEGIKDANYYKISLTTTQEFKKLTRRTNICSSWLTNSRNLFKVIFTIDLSTNCAIVSQIKSQLAHTTFKA
jgi:hypothetical protein